MRSTTLLMASPLMTSLLMTSLFMTGFLACGDDDGMIEPDAGVDADVDADVDSAVPDASVDALVDAPVDVSPDARRDPCSGDVVVDPLATDPAFAVIGSDFTSTTIGLLNGAGDVHTDVWLDSGTTAPGLVATLGGDVVFPTTTNGGALNIIDRFGVDVGTRLCFNGALVGQLRFSPGAFSTNVHDWVAVSTNQAWATRHERNADTTAPDDELGNDLVRFDPETMMFDGTRIDLSSFDETVDGRNSTGAMVPVATTARPDTIVQLGNFLVVGLARLPANLFADERGHAPGAVGIVDLTDESTSSFELTGLANCAEVQPVAGTTDEVIVSCVGYSDVGFGDTAGERASAGIVRLQLDAAGVASEVHAWRVADNVTAAFSVYDAVSLGGDLVAAVAPGDFVATNDELYVIDLSNGSQNMIAEGVGSFVIGQGAYDGSGLLLVPDASSTSIRRIETTDYLEMAPVTIGPGALPPRVVRAL